jgi:hypothetical protein
MRTRFFLWLSRLFTTRQTRRRYRPLLSADFAKGDLMKQAEMMFRAGYYNATAFQARFMIEKLVKRLGLITPKWETLRSRRKTSSAIHFLYETKIIDVHLLRQLQQFMQRTSESVHNRVVSRDTASRLLAESKVLRGLLYERIEFVLLNL